MSIFTIPSSLCDEIEKMMNSFWWGHSGARNKGIHWMSWDKLSMHKNDGGMGFKNLTAFNLALLGKQGWRIMSNPDILISKLYKAKYFPGCEFFESKVGHNPSFVWRSICNSKFLLRAGHLVVADVILPDTKGWNLPLLTTLLDSSGIDKVLHTPLFDSVVEDKHIWRMEKNGVYSVRSAYRLCVQELLDTSHLKMDDTWNLIWKLKAPSRVRNLLWRICRRCVPTRVNLWSRGVNCTTVCSLCNDHDEDSRHVFFDCPSSRNVWSMCSFGNKIIAALHNNYAASNLIFDLLQQLSNEDASLMACVIWSIWKQRNNRIWNNVIDAQNFVFSRAAALINDWCAVQQARPDVMGQLARDNAIPSKLQEIKKLPRLMPSKAFLATSSAFIKPEEDTIILVSSGLLLVPSTSPGVSVSGGNIRET
ncbi:unnamed protein product [Trifolium pratense]|uniref:Uncharacterized protein n=1 Tax=Trifolium pratense TaxID=57577 RepID=A0ACB0IY27_TRIPR|nr:unnamed protein product [Trifolium pratense]